jgi:Tfp pilus assembly protein PilF
MQTPPIAEQYERARRYYDARDYISAAEQFADVLTRDPDNLEVRLLLARAYYHSAQLTRAEATLRQVIERDPSEAYAYLMLGRVLQRQSRPDEAVAPLRLAAAMSDYVTFEG